MRIIACAFIFMMFIILGCDKAIQDNLSDPDPVIDDPKVIALSGNNRVMFYAESSYFGMLSGVYLMEDGSFISIDEPGYEFDDKELCEMGKIPDPERIKQLYLDQGFYSTKIIQDDDMSLICEGSYSVGVRINNTDRRLWSPCVDEADSNTKEAEKIMENLTLSIYSSIDPYKEPCTKGYYVRTHDMGLCQTIKELREMYGSDFEYDMPEEIPDIIRKSRDYAGAFITIDDPETLIDWNKRSYAVGDFCYYVSLLLLNGSFMPYDSHDD